jgi:hypothetical protein
VKVLRATAASPEVRLFLCACKKLLDNIIDENRVRIENEILELRMTMDLCTRYSKL